MNDLESQLREALRRTEPPPGWERRIVKRAAVARRARRLRQSASAIAVCLLLAAGGSYWQRQREARQARDQLIQALQITGEKLQVVERAAVENLNK